MTPGTPFAWPGGAVLLVMAPLLWLAVVARDRVRAAKLAATLGPRAEILSAALDPGRRRFRRMLLAVGLLLALVALMQPLGGVVPGGWAPRRADMVVCLDVSRSMLARDLAPSRLKAAKRDLRALAQRARGDRLGLVLFAGHARLAAPLTRDTEAFAAIADLADPLSIPRGGTDVGAALQCALGALEGSASERGCIVLLTDGEDLEQEGLRAAAQCRERRVPVHVVGYGSPAGAKIPIPGERGETFLEDRAGAEVVSRFDPAAMRQIADAAGGDLLAAAEVASPLVALYERRILPLASEPRDDGSRERRNLFQLPLLAALLLWILEMACTSRKRTSVPRRASTPEPDAKRALPKAATLLILLSTASGCGERDTAADLDRAAWEALRTGDETAAEIAAEKAAARGGPELEARRDFLLGNAAWARSVKEEFAAMGPRGAAAIDAAIAWTETARDSWRSGAGRQEDWPEARRNVERARLRLEVLRKKKEELTPDTRPKPKPKPDPRTRSDRPAPRREELMPLPKVQPLLTELSPEQVNRIFDRLKEKEREHARLKSQQRAAASLDVEKDW